MPPTPLQIVLLGLIQGAAELLPVSSSAHVIVAEKLMHLDPSDPSMTFLLVMLHTGTMAAVIGYFWRDWRRSFFATAAAFKAAVVRVAAATAVTGFLYLGLKKVIEKALPGGHGHAEIEQLFSNLTLIAVALAAAGVLIILAGTRGVGRGGPKGGATGGAPDGSKEIPLGTSLWIGAFQGLCLPFRGFSRSGATLSAGMLLGVGRRTAEEFSFALAVVLTPLAIAQELLRLLKARGAESAPLHLGSLLAPGLLGAVCSFLAGLLALRWLSRWLEGGRWHYFGVYCLVAAAGVFVLARAGL
jgi:undecaprenyl-diphosphatase